MDASSRARSVAPAAGEARLPPASPIANAREFAIGRERDDRESCLQPRVRRRAWIGMVGASAATVRHTTRLAAPGSMQETIMTPEMPRLSTPVGLRDHVRGSLAAPMTLPECIVTRS